MKRDKWNIYHTAALLMSATVVVFGLVDSGHFSLLLIGVGWVMAIVTNKMGDRLNDRRQKEWRKNYKG